MRFARIVLALSAAAFGGIAALFLVLPETMAAKVGLSLAGATADNDVRAVYGGLGLGLAAFLTMSVGRPAWHGPALWMAVLTLGAMATARCVSIVLVGSPEPIGFVLQAAEVTGFLLAAEALRRLEPGGPSDGER